jgi:hypothetical protein
MSPNGGSLARSVHVSTKKLSGHDPPYRHARQQDDFASRLHTVTLNSSLCASNAQMMRAFFAATAMIAR